MEVEMRSNNALQVVLREATGDSALASADGYQGTVQVYHYLIDLLGVQVQNSVCTSSK